MRRAFHLVGPIPDGIEPLTGYRLWKYDLGDRRAELHSFTCSGHRDCPWQAAGSGWVQAVCTAVGNLGHDAPEEGCTCGVYALASLDPFIDPSLDWSCLIALPGTVLGRVDLAGKIIEHEEGYRAERARIAELIPTQGSVPNMMRLANRLGLPLSRVVVPTPLDETPHAPRAREEVDPSSWWWWPTVAGWGLKAVWLLN